MNEKIDSYPPVSNEKLNEKTSRDYPKLPETEATRALQLNKKSKKEKFLIGILSLVATLMLNIGTDLFIAGLIPVNIAFIGIGLLLLMCGIIFAILTLACLMWF